MQQHGLDSGLRRNDNNKRRHIFVLLLAVPILFSLATLLSLKPIGDALHSIASDADTLQVTDRRGEAMSVSYLNRWNRYDTLPLHAMPPLLVSAFVASEDHRFYDHRGVDWRARAGALWQVLRHGERVRGASSIPEQVVRMVHPRPRHVWSKWLEGFEAAALSRRYSKEQILEFYINQVPYAANRRGVAQAARYYFDRDLSTLSPREMLALVVLARAPSAYDLYTHEGKIDGAILRLATRLRDDGALDAQDFATVTAAPLALQLPAPPVDASHFIRALRQSGLHHADARIRSTLDANLQRQVQQMLEDRLVQLQRKQVKHAAALVVDHQTGEILAWVVAGKSDINIVTAPRQPGSSLKPFLYAAALMKGWSPATLIDDAPISEAVGTGLHKFRNYSHRYYGPVTLREALGNSLNTPALRAIHYVTPKAYLDQLHALGFANLREGADVYDEGLALGSGEVSLFELVQAYTALAHRGEWRALRFTLDDAPQAEPRQIYSYEVASLVGNILSDPWAREHEFGRSSILNLPVQTAVKTGTSSDYRDAWAVGFDARYAVGIWMGNLDNQAMDGITGSTGPALTLRGVFTELNRFGETRPLALSPALERHTVCIATDDAPCVKRTEYFVAGTAEEALASRKKTEKRELLQPTQHLRLAYDPRIPAHLQAFTFKLAGLKPGERVRWTLNDSVLGETEDGRYEWPVARGSYTLAVTILSAKAEEALPPVTFFVR